MHRRLPAWHHVSRSIRLGVGAMHEWLSPEQTAEATSCEAVFWLGARLRNLQLYDEMLKAALWCD